MSKEATHDADSRANPPVVHVSVAVPAESYRVYGEANPFTILLDAQNRAVRDRAND